VNLAARSGLVALLCLLLLSPASASATSVDDYIQRSGLAEQLGLIERKGLLQIEHAQAGLQAQKPRLDRLDNPRQDRLEPLRREIVHAARGGLRGRDLDGL
jgi:hypothetical protein